MASASEMKRSGCHRSHRRIFGLSAALSLTGGRGVSPLVATRSPVAAGCVPVGSAAPRPRFVNASMERPLADGARRRMPYAECRGDKYDLG